LFKGAKEYKDLKEGDKEEKRRELLMTNLDILEFLGGKGMGYIQGQVLTLAVQGVKNAANAVNKSADQQLWIGDC
jgi:hypothetical protein